MKAFKSTAIARILAEAGHESFCAATVRELEGLAAAGLGRDLAGATATATHGTGLGLGNLATTIVGMEIVDGRGELIHCDEHERPELLRVARVGVGALGIVTRMTLQCVPRSTCTRPRPSSPSTACSTASSTTWPATTSGAVVERDCVDASHRVLVSRRFVALLRDGVRRPPRRACPRPSAGSAPWPASLPSPVTFPIEVRVSAADDIALSTAYDRDTGWFACHVYTGTPYLAYFQGVEAIAADYSGRPHWGKLHFHDHRSLAPLYPEWELFQRVRSELDPAGTFSNSYTDRVLGPIA